eukprot:12880474-Prorocentrum_lima.AAC.1
MATQQSFLCAVGVFLASSRPVHSALRATCMHRCTQHNLQKKESLGLGGVDCDFQNNPCMFMNTPLLQGR